MNTCKFCGEPTTVDICLKCYEYQKTLRRMTTHYLVETYREPTKYMGSHHLEIIKGVLRERGIREI